MHDLAAVRQHRRLDQFVIAVDGDLLRPLVDHRIEKGEQVPGIEQRSRGRDAARNIEMADDLDAVGGGDDLAGLGALDIAAALDGEVDDHRARLHRGDHRRRNQLRRRPAGNQRRGDHYVLLGDVLGRQRRLLDLVLFRHFLGVAARRLGGLELLVLDRQEFSAERLHLLLHRRAHVGGRDDAAKPARRGDRLQAGDADADDEYPGGGHGAGGRHHHRQGAVIFGRAVDHRLVAGEVGLAGQDVHRLRTRDARHEFHGERGYARLGHGGDRRVIAIGVHDGEHRRARLVAPELGLGRTADLEHHVCRRSVGYRADRGPDRLEIGVDDARAQPGARLHDHVEAKCFQPSYRVRRGADAPIVGVDFTRDIYGLSHLSGP